MARKFPHSPGRAFRIATHLSVVARFAVGATAILALTVPITVEHEPAPPMRLVDDGGGSTHSDPPYEPSPSKSSRSPSDGPSGNKDDEDEDGDGSSSSDDAAAGLPVAAQAGISLGVIGLAVVALLPGRRPPAQAALNDR